MKGKSPARPGVNKTKAEFVPTLGLFGATAISIAGIIGSGIFFIIGIASGIAGPAVILALIIAGAVALCTALSFATLGSKITKEGGEYQFVYLAFGKKVGLLAGILWIAATGIGGVTASLAFGSYLRALWPVAPVNVMASLACIVATLLDTGGLRLSSRVNIGLVAIKVIVLVLFVVLCIPSVRFSNFDGFFSKGAPGIIDATFIIFFAYAGFGKITAISEEVKNPRRTVPLAIIAAISISTLLYFSSGFTAVGVVGAEKLASAEFRTAPFAYVMRSAGYEWAFFVIAIGAITATASVLLTQLLGLSRTIYAMSVNGQLPAFLGELHPKFRTPYYGELIAGLLMALIAFFLNARTVITLTSLGILGYYSIINIAALVLKKQKGGFEIPRIIPLFGAVSGILLIIYFAVTSIFKL
jgi:APA family basic amino acid/polyamine antiporter